MTPDHNLGSPARRDGKCRIVRVDQSPMNPMIWVLQLACGHDIPVTQKRRPSSDAFTTDKATGEKLVGPRYVACWRCAERPVAAQFPTRD